MTLFSFLLLFYLFSRNATILNKGTIPFRNSVFVNRKIHLYVCKRNYRDKNIGRTRTEKENVLPINNIRDDVRYLGEINP